MLRPTAAAICLILAFAQTGYAQVATLAPPPPPVDPATAAAVAAATPPPPPPAAVAATPPPPPVAATPPPPPPTAVPVAPAPQAPPVTAVPAVAAPPPVQPPPPAVTAAPAPKAVATPPAAPVVTAAPAPQAVAPPPVTAAPVVTAAPAPKAVAAPPVTAAPVAKAAPVAAPTVTPVAPVAKSAPAPAPVAATTAKAAPGPAPSSAAVLPGVLPFPRAPAPAPGPAAPPRQCTNGPPRCKIFVEDTLCCGNAEGLVTDAQYLTVDVLCTESVVLPVGCLTVAPTLPNITVNPTFQPAGVSSTFHDFIIDFQNDGNFIPGPFSGTVTITLEALRNASSPNYSATCAQAISPCLYNGTLYNQTLPTFPVAVTVLDPLDYVEGYIGLPPTPTDTLGFSTNATNAAICGQADVGALPPTFYTGGFVNYTGFQNSCNTTRTVLDTYQFCEDYTIPAENRTLRNLPPAPAAPRVPGPSLGPSSKDGIRLF